MALIKIDTKLRPTIKHMCGDLFAHSSRASHIIRYVAIIYIPIGVFGRSELGITHIRFMCIFFHRPILDAHSSIQVYLYALHLIL